MPRSPARPFWVGSSPTATPPIAIIPAANAAWRISDPQRLGAAEGLCGDRIGFGRDLVHDLRRLIECARDGEAKTKAVKRLLAAIEWSRLCKARGSPTRARRPQRLERDHRLRRRPAVAADRQRRRMRAPP